MKSILALLTFLTLIAAVTLAEAHPVYTTVVVTKTVAPPASKSVAAVARHGHHAKFFCFWNLAAVLICVDVVAIGVRTGQEIAKGCVKPREEKYWPPRLWMPRCNWPGENTVIARG